MTTKILILLSSILLVCGCAGKEMTTTTTTTTTSLPANKENVTHVLEKLGYEVYGFDDGRDSLLGSRMIVGMVLQGNADMQASSAFSAMYAFDGSKDYYVVELESGQGVEFFLTRGTDMKDMAAGKINETEFYERNMRTVTEFYEAVNRSISGAGARLVLT